MKKKIIKNSILYLLIVTSYFVYQYLHELKRLFYFPWHVLGLILILIVFGVSIYMLEFSNRICNVVFCLLSAIAVSLFFIFTNPLREHILLCYIFFALFVSFLIGVAFPKKTGMEK